MKPITAEITYYVILAFGYGWAVVQLAANEPFDAFVLFIVTLFLHGYRNGVKE